MAAKNTNTAKRRTETKELPKNKKDVRSSALKQVKGGDAPLITTYDLKMAKK
ncbi:MAG TPA: hypothetical protein VMS31_03100 [Pyrinomonadaceae bacterium]|nr:hypothetical protein [Pyrinomonadaceae bacterium]